jgi:hypothetical protein
LDKLQGVGGKGEYAYRGVAAISGDMVAIVRMRTGGVAGNVQSSFSAILMSCSSVPSSRMGKSSSSEQEVLRNCLIFGLLSVSHGGSASGSALGGASATAADKPPIARVIGRTI